MKEIPFELQDDGDDRYIRLVPHQPLFLNDRRLKEVIVKQSLKTPHEFYVYGVGPKGGHIPIIFAEKETVEAIANAVKALCEYIQSLNPAG